MTTYASDFDAFLQGFFHIFTNPNFRGTDFQGYMNRPAAQRRGDEASIVDAAVTIPLLGLLGFAPAEQAYNRQHQENRPDFAPEQAVYGTCFVAENKSTALELDLDVNAPDGHLRQLARYARAGALRLGLLANGARITAWRFDDPDAPAKILDMDVPAAIQSWQSDPPTLPPVFRDALRVLYDLFRQNAFIDPDRLEQEVAISLEEWQRQALPLHEDSGHEARLVEAVRLLLSELQRDARRKLQTELERYETYRQGIERVSSTSTQNALEELAALRDTVLEELKRGPSLVLGLNGAEQETLTGALQRLESDARAFGSTKALLAYVVEMLNAARLRGRTTGARAARPYRNLDNFAVLRDAIQKYGDRTFTWHQRRTGLRAEYRDSIAVHDDYQVWVALVQETMLGDMNEAARRDEFALQAAYVVFIRLLLLRVCEDKGIFRNRFISDGGLKHWREDIDRYMQFADGSNAYDPLLDMAFINAKNIYAHFFTGRELFNWYRLERPLLLLALHQLGRFDFARVGSDILGTIYGTYVERKEKKQKGQYYTPPAIVNYILDEVGYRQDNNIANPNRRLIDPACGSGTFLVQAAQRLVAAYRQAGAQTNDPLEVLNRVRNNLYGFDLNPFACYLAEVNLLIQTLDLVKDAFDATGRPPKLEPFHIYNVDALARPEHNYYSAVYSTLLADELQEVDQIKSRAPGTPHANGFAFVVANPPYGATLTDDYKDRLRSDYANVFGGRVDTYIFFMKLGMELLGAGGKMGYITPNTFLMGVQAAPLREQILAACRINQIVDLPQGIWDDATVDCVLTFLSADSQAETRTANTVQVYSLGLRDSLDKLTSHDWAETFQQPQSVLEEAPLFEMNMRNDALTTHIEEACWLNVGSELPKTVLRLGDVTESTRGLEPYHSEAQGKARMFVKYKHELSASEAHWKPLLDTESNIGRYEFTWGKEKPHLNYGSHLYRAYDSKYFERPKLIIIRFRNKSLKRRLVVAYDEQGFYARENFSVINAGSADYDLKYLLALVNSSVLNFWYARRNDQVTINPVYFRQLPIFPADRETQAGFVTLVDALLAKHRKLNALREQGYTIHAASGRIAVPYDGLLEELLATNGGVLTLSLFDALASGLASIAPGSDLQATVSGRVQERGLLVALRHRTLGLNVPDARLRRYLAGYLGRPRWQGKTWADIKDAPLPDGGAALDAFFALEAARIAHIQALLDDAARLDADIDRGVLDLYRIADPADRARILGSSPPQEEAGDAGEDAAEGTAIEVLEESS